MIHESEFKSNWEVAKMRKTLVVLLLGVLAAAVVLAGCGSKSSESSGGNTSAGTQQEKPKSEKTTLTFWTYVEQHAEFFQDAAESWNEKHPDEQI